MPGNAATTTCRTTTNPPPTGGGFPAPALPGAKTRDTTHPTAAPPAPPKFDLSDLAGFHGGDELTGHWSRRLKYTDGIKFLAGKAGAFWLIDAIASHQPKAVRLGLEPQFWALVPTPTKNYPDSCAWNARADRDVPPTIRQRIEYTDFPFAVTDGKPEKFAVWVCNGVLMLPSEYYPPPHLPDPTPRGRPAPPALWSSDHEFAPPDPRPASRPGRQDRRLPLGRDRRATGNHPDGLDRDGDRYEMVIDRHRPGRRTGAPLPAMARLTDAPNGATTGLIPAATWRKAFTEGAKTGPEGEPRLLRS